MYLHPVQLLLQDLAEMLLGGVDVNVRHLDQV